MLTDLQLEESITRTHTPIPKEPQTTYPHAVHAPMQSVGRSTAFDIASSDSEEEACTSLKVRIGPGKGKKKQKKGQPADANIQQVQTAQCYNSDEECVLDFSDRDADSVDEEPASSSSTGTAGGKLEQQKKMWPLLGWKQDPRKRGGVVKHTKPRLNFGEHCQLNAIDYFLNLLPIQYIKREILPSLPGLTFEEFVCFLGLCYSMEVLGLPERRMYWRAGVEGFLTFPDFGRYMSLQKFENILRSVQFSLSNDRDQQILDLLDALNENVQEKIIAGDVLTLDESMIKGHHRDMKGKVQIKRKPRPIGNEVKNVCDAQSKIVLNMELVRGKNETHRLEYFTEYGATTACSLRLTKPWRGSGKIVVGDSWFGSVKCSSALMREFGLYSIMLVKTAHRDYPKLFFSEKDLRRGQWKSVSCVKDGVELMATRYMDLKMQDFISTCSTELPGKPRETKHFGRVPRPMVAEEYLNHCTSIDIHNHFRTGASALEDVIKTKSYIIRQFCGLLGFVFTNSYLAMTYFSNISSKSLAISDKLIKGEHLKFKIELCNQLLAFKDNVTSLRQSGEFSVLQKQTLPHHMVPLDDKRRKQLNCYYCQHGRQIAAGRKCSYKCLECDKPFCSTSTGRSCFIDHIANGLPEKKYRKK